MQVQNMNTILLDVQLCFRRFFQKFEALFLQSYLLLCVQLPYGQSDALLYHSLLIAKGKASFVSRIKYDKFLKT